MTSIKSNDRPAKAPALPPAAQAQAANPPPLGASSGVSGKYTATDDVYEALDTLGVKCRQLGTTALPAAKAQPGELIVGTSAKGELTAYVGPGAWRRTLTFRGFTPPMSYADKTRTNVHQTDRTGHFAITNVPPGETGYFGVDGALKTAEKARVWSMAPTAYFGTLEVKNLPHEARAPFHSGEQAGAAGDIGGRYGYIGEQRQVPPQQAPAGRYGRSARPAHESGQANGIAGLVCAPNAGYGVLAIDVATGEHKVLRDNLIEFKSDDLVPVVDGVVQKDPATGGNVLGVQPCFCPLPETKLLESMPIEWWTKDNCEAKLNTMIEYYFEDYPKWRTLNNTKKSLRNLLFEFAVAFAHERLQDEKADFFMEIHSLPEAKKFRADLLEHLRAKAKTYGVQLKDLTITAATYREVDHKDYGFDPKDPRNAAEYASHNCPTTEELGRLRSEIQSLVNQVEQAPGFHTKKLEEKIAEVRNSRETTSSVESAERIKILAEAQKTYALLDSRLKAVTAKASSDRQNLLKGVAAELQAVSGEIREQREKALGEILDKVTGKIRDLEKATEVAAEGRLKDVDAAKVTALQTEKLVEGIKTEAVKDTAGMKIYSEMTPNAVAAKTRAEVSELLALRSTKLAEIQAALEAAIQGKGTFGLDADKRFRAYLVKEGREPFNTVVVDGLRTLSMDNAQRANIDPESLAIS